MENEEFILGYQWSPKDSKYMSDYRFPNNKDKTEIYIPPFTTLVKPPETEKGFAAYWNDNEWIIKEDPDSIFSHTPIDDYEMLMPDYIEYLKDNNLWTEDDQKKRQDALDNVEKRRIEAERNREEWERNRDYLTELREIRNQLLISCDWTQLPDVQEKFTSSEKEEWSEYRQKLRDLPENIQDPKPLVLDLNHPDWPISPA
jgi:hypothetical protein